jgi:hypothetical protein
MPGKLFYLDDRRDHIVTERDYKELSMLPTEAGPRLVVAKGTVESREVLCRFRLRLEVHSILPPDFGGGLIGFDETDFVGHPASNNFMLVVAAEMPHGGVGVLPGAPLPPPNRAVLHARRESLAVAEVLVTNVRITSFPLDEIVATVI